ncbi:hypothetical protein AB0C77_26145 [Streptomyces sp. NPDC048629]|uniref:hypothetical protein n=1 Tax=Streptomyces sp. NPDC048629 TaxID=3154824 RepID=UPI00342BC2A8
MLDASDVGRLVEESSFEVVVLERVAYGAGQTNWFVCRDSEEYFFISNLLLPGSCVTVCLDGRISKAKYAFAIREKILRIAELEHDCVVGMLGVDRCRLDVEFIAGDEEMDDFEAALGDRSEIFFGAFPGRSSEEGRVITFTVPDSDGVVRNAPH